MTRAHHSPQHGNHGTFEGPSVHERCFWVKGNFIASNVRHLSGVAIAGVARSARCRSRSTVPPLHYNRVGQPSARAHRSRAGPCAPF